MAREEILIEEIRKSGKLKNELTQSTHSDVIVDIFIQILRECLSKHPIYTYVSREDNAGPDFENTQIVIVDKYTEEALFLPSITMGLNSANTKWIQFSQSPFQTVIKPQMNADGSIMRDERGRAVPSHYEYVGAYDSSLTFLISANDTLEREELCNLLHVLFAESLRDELYIRGVFVKNVSVGGQTETEYLSDYMYQAPVTVEIYSEWRRMIPVGETLKSIGFDMEVVSGSQDNPPAETTIGDPITIYNLDNEFYVVDDATDEPVIPSLQLSATSVAAPVTLVYDSIAARWEVSDFWIKALEQSLIPYENFRVELKKNSATNDFLIEAGKAIVQAETLRGLALSQGRTLPDGSKVIGNYFIFPDGRVKLSGGTDLDDALVYSTTVFGDNTVEFRATEKNKNKPLLVARNVTVDSNGLPLTGSIYKKIVQLGNPAELLLSTTDHEFLTGENINTMTAVDLFMIMQFADQPFRYTIHKIVEEIDNLLVELADLSLTISNRGSKITSITNIKQELIARTEQFLLTQPIGI